MVTYNNNIFHLSLMPACRPLFTDFSLHMVGKVKYFLLDEKVFDLYELVTN